MPAGYVTGGLALTGFATPLFKAGWAMSSEVGDGAARQATGRHQRPASISRHGIYVHKSESRNKSPFAGETQVTCINKYCTGAASARYQCNSNRVVDFGLYLG